MVFRSVSNPECIESSFSEWQYPQFTMINNNEINLNCLQSINYKNFSVFVFKFTD